MGDKHSLSKEEGTSYFSEAAERLSLSLTCRRTFGTYRHIRMKIQGSSRHQIVPLCIASPEAPAISSEHRIRRNTHRRVGRRCPRRRRDWRPARLPRQNDRFCKSSRARLQAKGPPYPVPLERRRILRLNDPHAISVPSNCCRTSGPGSGNRMLQVLKSSAVRSCRSVAKNRFVPEVLDIPIVRSLRFVQAVESSWMIGAVS
jgi:hypothetical protein